MPMNVSATPATRPVAPQFPYFLNNVSFARFDDFRRVAQSRQSLMLHPGQSFRVYVPTTMGAGWKLEDLNKNSPFTVKEVNLPAPVRTPGRWIEFTAKSTAAEGAKDRVKFASYPVVFPPATKPSSQFAFTLEVAPWLR